MSEQSAYARAGVDLQAGKEATTLMHAAVKATFGPEVLSDVGAFGGLFAAGDATTVPYKQIVVAMGAGSTAMLSAFDHLIRTPVSAAA